MNASNVALQTYAGTVRLVTHGQGSLQEVGTRVWQPKVVRIIGVIYEKHPSLLVWP